ncbi:hydrogenase maturation protease [Streptomyces broussonetiae]|uniref:Hydrogenase maturation protease n=1 Tax=Streptomyces broussonetiae TaxID=2686304 RepID=A0ABV5E409_9ACTN
MSVGRIVVIGVGNEFRHDDGVGWAVTARLAERAAARPLPPGTVLENCDGDPARLLGLWEDAALAVVVDAAHARPPHPGRVHRLTLDGTGTARTTTTSSHGLGLGDAVELSRVLDRLPGRLVVYAVEGADRSQGRGLSAAVAARVEEVADSVEADLRHGPGGPGDAHGPAGPAAPDDTRHPAGPAAPRKPTGAGGRVVRPDSPARPGGVARPGGKGAPS